MNFKSYHKSANWTKLFGVVLVLAFVTAANAALITFDESGYVAAADNSEANIYDQQGGVDTAAWTGADAFTVVTGAGVGGTNGLVTAQSATSYQSCAYDPLDAEMDNIPFDASSSVVAYSMDIQLAKVNTSNNVMRLYIGKHAWSSSTYALCVYLKGSGSFYTAGGYYSSGSPFSDNEYHTFSGIIDFGSMTYSLSLDGTELVADQTFDATSAAYSTYGGFKLNTQTTDYVNNEVRFDNLEYSPIPEPATIGLMCSGGLLVYLRRKRC